MLKNICCAFICLSALFSSSADAQTDCNLAMKAGRIASSIRRLPIKRIVPCKVTNKTAVEAYLRETINSKVPKDKLQGEEIAYKILGLVPEDYDYMNGVIALYTEQIGGYYDAEKNYYAMAAWMPEIMQLPVAVHELTHALQDQHFDLDTFTAEKDRSSDELLARSALLEGDATAVMIDHTRQLSGQASIAKEESVSIFLAQNLMGMMLTPSLHSAPGALQALMIFPYMSGLNYTHALLRAGGYEAVSKAYARPPASTEQVLHPEKYLRQSDEPRSVLAKTPTALGPKGKKITEDTYGEFVISTLLNSWLPAGTGASGAAGWGGDRMAVFDGEDRYWLTWQLSMDTVSDAEELAQLLHRAYEKRFTKVAGSRNEFRGESKRVSLTVKQEGETLFLEGSLLK